MGYTLRDSLTINTEVVIVSVLCLDLLIPRSLLIRHQTKNRPDLAKLIVRWTSITMRKVSVVVNVPKTHSVT